VFLVASQDRLGLGAGTAYFWIDILGLLFYCVTQQRNTQHELLLQRSSSFQKVETPKRLSAIGGGSLDKAAQRVAEKLFGGNLRRTSCTPAVILHNLSQKDAVNTAGVGQFQSSARVI